MTALCVVQLFRGLFTILGLKETQRAVHHQQMTLLHVHRQALWQHVIHS